MKTFVILLLVAYGTATVLQGNSGINLNNMDADTIIRMFFNLNNEAVKKCTDNGNTEALNKAQNAGLKLVTCIQPNRDLSANISAIWKSNRTITVDEVTTLCREYPAIQQNCTLEYQASLRPCLNDSDMNAIELLFNMTYADNRKTCENQGQVITNLNLAGIEECVPQISSGMMGCLAPFVNSFVNSDFSLLSLARYLSSEEGCRMYRQGAACIQEQMEVCVDRSFPNIMMGTLNATLSVMPECSTEVNNNIQVIRFRRALEVLESKFAPGAEKFSLTYLLHSSFKK